jgi:hypothetical protein
MVKTESFSDEEKVKNGAKFEKKEKSENGGKFEKKNEKSENGAKFEKKDKPEKTDLVVKKAEKYFAGKFLVEISLKRGPSLYKKSVITCKSTVKRFLDNY